MMPSRALVGAALLLSVLALTACDDEEEGRAFRGPSSVPAPSVSDVTEPDPADPTPGGLSECTDGVCTAEFTTGDSLDFESGLGLADLEVDEVGDDSITMTARSEPGQSGVICSGGCSVSTRSSAQGSTIELTARAGANIILAGFPMQVLGISGGTATVRLGGG